MTMIASCHGWRLLCYDFWQRLGGYRRIDWIKFAIPLVTATTALIFCFWFLWDCRSSVHVVQEGEWLGVFTHTTTKEDGETTHGACVSYPNHTPPLLRAAQAGTCIVWVLAVPLWICLAASPCWKRPNQVWPKLMSIVVALVIGNAQLWTVVKFIRFVVSIYPNETGLSYQNRVVVMGSVLFWFATGIAIPLCAVPTFSSSVSSPQERSAPASSSSSESSSSSSSSESSMTRDLELLDPAQSLDTIEEGGRTIQIHCSHSKDSTTMAVNHDENDEGEGCLLEAIELSL